MNTFDLKLVEHIAELANIPLRIEEANNLAEGFNTTLKVVEKLTNLDTGNLPMTHQVTGLENVFREDRVEKERMFTQNEALANAKRKHDGYFVVERLIDNN